MDGGMVMYGCMQIQVTAETFGITSTDKHFVSLSPLLFISFI